MKIGRGNYIGGSFHQGDIELRSKNPARDFVPVFKTHTSLFHVSLALDAARHAQHKWFALPQEKRNEHLQNLKEAFVKHEGAMAEAILMETGKPMREAKGEAKALGARIDLTIKSALPRIQTHSPAGIAGEQRAHPQGVLVVLGPYNYPAHLLNAHIIPALLTGNTVVVKPSEHCLWTGALYADIVHSAGLPMGVFNMVQGAGDVGKALVAHPGSDGVLFTGSYATGRRIQEELLDSPHKIAALEMGGKNPAVILDDADLQQALTGVLQGAFLTAGQRCTATSRVLVHKRVSAAFTNALVNAAARLRPGDPRDPASPFGPLANEDAYHRFLKLRALADERAKVLLKGEALGGGAFVTPSVHMATERGPDIKGYTDEELFGPDLFIEEIDDDDHAIERLRASPYGLSTSIFTRDKERLERFYVQTRTGLLNWNRSTNGASGQLPFGGVGRSGNQRPAGIEAVRYTTYPVAVMHEAPGAFTVDPTFESSLSKSLNQLGLHVDELSARHDVERLLERYHFFVDGVQGINVLVGPKQFDGFTIMGEALTLSKAAADIGEGAQVQNGLLVLSLPKPKGGELTPEGAAFMARLQSFLESLLHDNPGRVLRRRAPGQNAPPKGEMPRSTAYLKRLYRGNFVPQERKPAVIDHAHTEGVYLTSIDDDPLCIIDGASQIASVGLGFAPSIFSRKLDEGAMSTALLSNAEDAPGYEESLPSEDYAAFLIERASDPIRYASFASGGSEANERAFDLCRMNGPGGTRVIAFEGSFHGRTMVSLHSTYNKVKRAPFELEGYETAYAPLPVNTDPQDEPAFDTDFIKSCADKNPKAHGSDPLFHEEVACLNALKALLEEDGNCCVILEPMQGEGGDNYITARFANGVRALTRAYNTPLVFDEVQVGFGLGGPFYWTELFDLKDAQGKRDGPDCITLAKKAQLGVCLSAWPDPRPTSPHQLQALRGLWHAQEILTTNLHALEPAVARGLERITLKYPELVKRPRGVAMTFGFDLPDKARAVALVAQRFYRGFMAYNAGEKTVRFRLNHAYRDPDVEALFNGIDAALALIQKSPKDQKAPAWIDTPSKQRTRADDFLDDPDPEARFRRLLALPASVRARAADKLLLRVGEPSEEAMTQMLGVLDVEEGDVSLALERLAEMPREARKKLPLAPDQFLAALSGARIIEINIDNWESVKAGVMAIENATYEDGRRESEAEIYDMVNGEGVALLAVTGRGDHQHVLGYAFGGPLERFLKADGPIHDVYKDANNTFYSSNMTLAPQARGRGLGMRLKTAQWQRVKAQKDAKGAPRFAFMTGRNRVGHTLVMERLNQAFGAYTVEHFRGNQYGDLSGEALYYRQRLQTPRTPHALREAVASKRVDWSAGIEAPLGHRHPALESLVESGAFLGPVGSKLTLSNFITPEVVRYGELLRRVAPQNCKHAYFTSGRSELVDKGLRSLRVKRPEGRVLIGLEHQYLGTTTAASRSLTSPEGQAQPFEWYDFPKIPHPAEVGTDAAVGALMAAIESVNKERVLGIVVELVGEKSGLTLPASFTSALFQIRKDTGIPIVSVETASALGRLGPHLFASDGWDESPNMVWWYAGAQLGHIFCDDEMFVEKPLTLISTWDGDEVSILRTGVHLRQAHHLLHDERREAFAAAVKKILPEACGAGFHFVLKRKDAVSDLQRLKDAGVTLSKSAAGALVISPPLVVDNFEETLKLIASRLG